MTTRVPVIDAILNRRSVAPRRQVPPGPGPADVRLMVEAAIAAPDHGRLRPWRFVLVEEKDRASLAALFAAAAREHDPDAPPQAAEREAEKARHGAVLLAVVVRIVEEHPVAPAHEQWASAGAAVQNMLLAAESLGFGAMIVSGKKVTSAVLRNAFAGAADEHLMGFVAIGTPSDGPPRPQRPEPEDHLSTWIPAGS
jgi:nitroreductase